MGKTILWQNLSARQIQQMIRDWPVAGQTVETREIKFPKKASTKRQRHHGADGEVKFVEHRKLYVGFWGGRVVVTKRTAEACHAFISANYRATKAA